MMNQCDVCGKPGHTDQWGRHTGPCSHDGRFAFARCQECDDTTVCDSYAGAQELAREHRTLTGHTVRAAKGDKS